MEGGTFRSQVAEGWDESVGYVKGAKGAFPGTVEVGCMDPGVWAELSPLCLREDGCCGRSTH